MLLGLESGLPLDVPDTVILWDPEVRMSGGSLIGNPSHTNSVILPLMSRDS